MSLVGYEYSDDEDGQVSSENELLPKDITNGNKATSSANIISDIKTNVSNDLPKGSTVLLKQLPPSVSSNLSKDVVKKTSSGRIQITVPSLSILNQVDSDDDSDEEERQRKRLKKSDHGCRLISILPRPKNAINSKPSTITSLNVPSTSSLTSLVPNSVTNRTKSSASSKVKSPSTNVVKNDNTHIDKRPSTSSSFFFTNDGDDDDDEDEDGVKIPFADQLMKEPFIYPSSSQASVVDSNAPIYGPAKPEPTNAIVGDSLYSPEEQMAIDPNQDITYKKFIASKFGEDPAESIKFVDFDMSKHLSQNQDWLKKITVEQSVQEEEIDGPTPNSTARRKNQITFLAYQAKKREVDLKNQWAQNKQTKNQTRAKYGF